MVFAYLINATQLRQVSTLIIRKVKVRCEKTNRDVGVLGRLMVAKLKSKCGGLLWKTWQ